jgi:hypothetical protein
MNAIQTYPLSLPWPGDDPVTKLEWSFDVSTGRSKACDPRRSFLSFGLANCFPVIFDWRFDFVEMMRLVVFASRLCHTAFHYQGSRNDERDN